MSSPNDNVSRGDQLLLNASAAALEPHGLPETSAAAPSLEENIFHHDRPHLETFDTSSASGVEDINMFCNDQALFETLEPSTAASEPYGLHNTLLATPALEENTIDHLVAIAALEEIDMHRRASEALLETSDTSATTPAFEESNILRDNQLLLQALETSAAAPELHGMPDPLLEEDNTLRLLDKLENSVAVSKPHGLPVLRKQDIHDLHSLVATAETSAAAPQPYHLPGLKASASPSATPRNRGDELSNENLKTIFSMATSQFPSAFSSDFHEISAFARDRDGTYFRLFFHWIMDTKLAINSVSRKWRSLSYPFLFEHLVITTLDQALRVASAVGRLDQGLPNTIMGYYTARIDLAFRPLHSAWNNVSYNNAIFRILSYCPNIVCFSTAFSVINPAFYHTMCLANTLTLSRIKRVELRTQKLMAQYICTRLAGSLEVAWFIHGGTVEIDDRERREPSMPNLRVLICEVGCATWLGECHVPSLEAFIFSSEVRTLSSKTLRYLSIPRLEPSLCHWPNLTFLVLKFQGLAWNPVDWARMPLIYPSLKCVIIEELEFVRNWGPYKDLWYHNFCRLFSLDIFPALKTIRFLLPLAFHGHLDPTSRQISSAFWRGWLNACESRNIKLEGLHGPHEWYTNAWRTFTPDQIHDILFS